MGSVLVFEEGLLEHLRRRNGTDEVLLDSGLDVVLEETSKEFDGEVLLSGNGPDLVEEFIGEE
jgi:hypothetical protein